MKPVLAGARKGDRMAATVVEKLWSSRARPTRTWTWQAWRPRVRTLVAAPFIFVMIVPLVILDVCVEIYQRVVFPLLGAAVVSRREFIRFDRLRLEYLDPIQKLGCWYCGYANGLLHYASRIAEQTEEIFRPIEQQPVGGFHHQQHHIAFASCAGP